MRSLRENTEFQRKCIKCKSVKELTAENFYREKSRQYGFSYICKECEKERRTEKHFKRYYGHYDKEKHRRKQYYWGKGYISAQVKNCRIYDKKKGWENDLTVEFYDSLFPTECTYCGESIKAGLDRIDNNKPHNEDNVIPCCALCNWIRNDKFTVKEMKMIGEVVKKIKELRLKEKQDAQPS